MSASHRLPSVSPSLASRSILLAVLASLMVACGGDPPVSPRRAMSPLSRPHFGRSEPAGRCGGLAGATLVRRIDSATVAAVIARNGMQGAFVARHAVQQWDITYFTVDARGEPRIASAVVYLPDTTGVRLPLVSVSHGTITIKSAVPSNPTGSIAQGIAHAGHGSVAVFADYLGLGVDSVHYQPYLVADVNAATSLDALRAARTLVERQGDVPDGRLYIAGYSEGGQVAMALARLIETDPGADFQVTAAAPASGPYDLYRTARIALSRDTAYVPSAIYTTLAVAAYQQTYDLADSLDQLLTPAVTPIAERLVMTGMTPAELSTSLPAIAREVMQPDALDAVLHDPGAPLSRALRRNRTYEWMPTAPLRLYYGSADIDVPPVNALVAARWMRRVRGRREASDVEAVELIGAGGQALNHNSALLPSILATRRWFDSLPAPIAPLRTGAPPEGSVGKARSCATTTLALTPDPS